MQLGAVSTRNIDGQKAEFGTAGYTMDHIFVLYDRATRSVWYPGENQDLLAVGGIRKGTSLPFLVEPAPIRLDAWLEQHPDSTVLLPTEEDAEEFEGAWSGFRLSREEQAPVIGMIFEDSPAAHVGLQEGDQLLSVNGEPVESRRDVQGTMTDLVVGDTIEIELQREEATQTITLTMGQRP